MKRFNWISLPGIVVSFYFIYIGLTKLSSNFMFMCIWLFLSGTGCYQSICIFIGRPMKMKLNSSIKDDNETKKRLKELDELYDQGIITRAELDENRDRILKDI